jgi:hypothetical protein
MSERLATPENELARSERIELTANPEAMPPVVSPTEVLLLKDAPEPIRLAATETLRFPEKAKRKSRVLPFLFNNLYWLLAAIPTVAAFIVAGPFTAGIFATAVIVGGNYSPFWKVLTLASLGGLLLGNAVPLAFHILAMGLYVLLKTAFPAKH